MLRIKDLNILNPVKIENCNQEFEITGAHFDSRKCLPGFLYIAIKGANNDGHDFIKSAIDNGAVAAVVHISYQNTQNYPVIYTDNNELFFARAANLWRKRCSATVIGLTGTNGKTSTKEMIGAILSPKYNTVVTEGNFNNQLGVPLTLFRIQQDTQFAVIEMGTNHFGEIAFLADIAAPEIGLITNIGEGHLEELNDKQGVLKEKTALFEYLKSHNGCFLINDSDELLSAYPYNYAKTKRFGTKSENDLSFTKTGVSQKGFGQFTVNQIEVNLGSYGTTGCKNALAAMAVGVELGLSIEEMCSSLQGFGAASKRGEIFKTGTSDIIVDCYNANPSSMEESIGNLLYDNPQKSMLVLGDMLELGDSSASLHARLGEFLDKHDFGYILLFGDEMSACWQVLKNRDNVEYFAADFQSLQNRFESLATVYSRILLKGSRGVSLERVLKNLKRVENNE